MNRRRELAEASLLPVLLQDVLRNHFRLKLIENLMKDIPTVLLPSAS